MSYGYIVHGTLDFILYLLTFSRCLQGILGRVIGVDSGVVVSSRLTLTTRIMNEMKSPIGLLNLRCCCITDVVGSRSFPDSTGS